MASIKIDDTNSNVINATNLSAFSVNTGFLFHITQEINLGITYGWDNLMGSDNSKSDWKYNGKGWLGLGINVSFSNQNANTGSIGTN